MKIVAAIFLLFAVTLVLGESSYSNDLDFLKWSREHLSAATREELERVYPTWRRNADYVRNHRDKRFTVALNRFAHLVRGLHGEVIVHCLELILISVFKS